MAHVTLEVIEVTGSVVEVQTDVSVELDVIAESVPTVEVVESPADPVVVEITTGPEGPAGPGSHILSVGATEPDTTGWAVNEFWYDTSTE